MRTYVNSTPWVRQHPNNTSQSGALGTWTNAYNYLPKEIYNTSSVVLKNYAFVIQGYAEYAFTNTIYRASINSSGIIGSFSLYGTVPNTVNSPSRMGAAIAVLNDKLFILGGQTSSSTITSSVISCVIGSDGSLSSWANENSLPSNLTGRAVLCIKNYLYSFGGNTNTAARSGTAKIYRAAINPSTGAVGTWSEYSVVLPDIRKASNVVLLGDKLYCVGGANNYGDATTGIYVSTVDAEGGFSSFSSYANSCPTSIGKAECVSTNGTLYVIGGASSARSVFSSPINSSYALGTCVTGSLPSGFPYTTTTLVTSSKLYSLGGYSDSATSNLFNVAFSGGLNDYTGLDFEETGSSIDFVVEEPPDDVAVSLVHVTELTPIVGDYKLPLLEILGEAVNPPLAVYEPFFWNPALPYTVLSNGNHTFAPSGDFPQVASWSLYPKTLGKWYWEIVLDTLGVIQYYATYIGATSLPAYSVNKNIGSEYPAWGFCAETGQKYSASNAYWPQPFGNAATTGDVIGVALDLDTGKIYFSLNGVWQASGNPSANTNAAYSWTPDGTPIYPAVSVSGAAAVTTGRFLPTALEYPVPTGFTAIDTSQNFSSLGYYLPSPFSIKYAGVDGNVFAEGDYQPGIFSVNGVTDTAFTAAGNLGPLGPIEVKGTGLPGTTFDLLFKIVNGSPRDQQSDLVSDRGNREIGPWVGSANYVGDPSNNTAFWAAGNKVFSASGTYVYMAEISAEGVLGVGVLLPARLPAPRYKAQAVITYRRVYLIGGNDGTTLHVRDGLTASIEPDGSLGDWEVVTNLLADDYPYSGGQYINFALVSDGNRVYLLGGENYFAESTSTTQLAYIDAAGKLGPFSYDSYLPDHQFFKSQAVLKTPTYVYLVGGEKGPSYQNGGVTNKVFRQTRVSYGLSTSPWVEITPFVGVPAMWGARGFTTKHRAWLFGGNNGRGGGTLDVRSAPIYSDGTIGDFELSPFSLYGTQGGNHAFSTSSTLYIGASAASFRGGFDDYQDVHLQGPFPPAIALGNVNNLPGQVTGIGSAQGAVTDALARVEGTADWGFVATGAMNPSADSISGILEFTSYTAVGAIDPRIEFIYGTFAFTSYAVVGSFTQPVDIIRGKVLAPAWAAGNFKEPRDTCAISWTAPVVAQGNFKSKRDRVQGLGPTAAALNELLDRIQGTAIAGYAATGRLQEKADTLAGAAHYIFYTAATGRMRGSLDSISGSSYYTEVAVGQMLDSLDRVQGIGWVIPTALGNITAPKALVFGRAYTASAAQEPLKFSIDQATPPTMASAEYTAEKFERCPIKTPTAPPTAPLDPLHFSKTTTC